jgi:polysaccharide biosynthesis protein PslG
VRRLVIATALLACLTFPVVSQGKPHGKPHGKHHGKKHRVKAAPRSFYGVMGAQDPDPTEIARMGAGRVGTLRINLVWGNVQPTAGAPYDWSHYDAIVGAAAQQGIRVLFTISSSPTWVAAKSNYPPTGDFVTPFRDFVFAAAQRYGSNGAFWASNPAIPRIPVIYWQLWNEMNSPSFWFDPPSPQQYVQLLQVFSSAVKTGDRNAKIVLGGLFRTPQLPNSIPLVSYLPQIYKAGGKRFFDAVSVHPYANAPKDALRAVKQTRKIMDRFKDKKARLWITEIGWATGGNASPLTVTPDVQAADLTRSYRLLAKTRKRLKLIGAIWYSWRDLPGQIWFNHTGLFDETLNPKPSWYAFVGLTHGSPG